VSTPVTTTGLYPWTLKVVTKLSSGASLTSTTSGVAAVVVNTNSPFGAGWSMAGVDQLVAVSGGVILVYGHGGSRYFAQGGGNTYVSPSNDFGSLVKNGDGSYTYTAKDQVRYNYTSQGRLVTVVDPHNLVLTYTYDGSGRLTGVAEPDGGVTTFTYDGNGL